MVRSYKLNEIKKLWALSAGRCAFPDCKNELIAESTNFDPEVVIGFTSHICAFSSKGPRGDPNFPEDKRNLYPNLILFCGHHHTIVDKQPNTYTISDLKEWKKKHEDWVRKQLVKEMPSLHFEELEILTKNMIETNISFDGKYDIITPREKINKNGLSNEITFLITLGLSKSREVSEFIQRYSTIDQTFPNKLKKGFVTEYERLRFNEGLLGDDLFRELHNFASMGKIDFKWQCAGLAVLTYLFERCEVFEK